MIESKRYFGRIFFPDKPDVKISGAWLTIAEKSISIEAPINTHKNDDWPIVLGEFNGLDKVTLLNCRSGGGSSGAGGTYGIIKARFILAGIHIHTNDELKFNRATLFSSALENWIRENEWIDEEGESKYVIPKPKEIVNTNIESFSIVINTGHSIRQGVELHAHKVCTVQFISEIPTHFNDLLESIRHLKKLILFLTNKNPEFESAYFFIGDYQVELLNTSSPLEDKKFTQFIRIEYSEVKSYLTQLIQNWFTQKRLYPVVDLVLEKCFNTQMSSEGFFLNVCVAMESFHRRFGKENVKKIKLDEPQNKQAIIELLKDNCELLKWFKDKSTEWEKPSLKERLFEFKGTVKYVIGTVFPFDIEEFIKRTVQTRNDMAHEGEHGKRFSDIELFLASKVIEYTLRLEILKLFGVNVNSTSRSLMDEAKNNIETLARLNDYNQFEILKNT